jgi:lysophospholipase L1-like esterase
MTRRLFTSCSVLLATAALLLSAGTAANAASPSQAKAILTQTNYVALGDSFATGSGLGTYGSSGTCYRSQYSYPVVASGGTAEVTFLACNGATTASISGQLAKFSGKTADVAYVTLTIGGNDAGFVDALTRCLKLDDCTKDAAFTGSVATKTAAVKASIAANLAAIQAKFGSAKVIVTGYPKLFQVPSTKSLCSVGSLMSVTKAEANYLDGAAVSLNASIKAGLPAGVAYADVATPFTGHGLCQGSSASWINSLNILNTLGAFHPNKTGQASGYATAVAAQVG